MVLSGYGGLLFLTSSNQPRWEGQMDAALINTQRPQLTQAAAERRWNSARERNVRTPHPSTPRSRSVHARQGKSVSSLTAAAPATADHRQAEYFVRLLTQSRQRIDQRINNYQRAIAVSEASGDTENIRGLRRMARVEEQDRETVGGLIESLQRRFPVRAPGEVPQIPRRARPVVR
jgi:hypothetical protein